jgi:N-acetylneuraminate synthase
MNKTFIIAEVGINANGDIENAKKLIKTAKEVGCDAVKFQKRSIDRVYTQEELDKYRESPWGRTNREQKEGLEFGEVEYDIINACCKAYNIEWFASPWDLESVEFLKKYNLKYNKIASAMLLHKELIQKIAEQKKYTFISTGMSTMEQIEDVIKVFIDNGCPYEIMHCNSAYPSDPRDLNLNAILTLKEKFNCKVGYSGHEVGLIPSVAAVALGATSIERHITLNRSMYGSDQSASIEPGGFRKLVEYIREVEESLGDGIKIITRQEEQCRTKLQRRGDYA